VNCYAKYRAVAAVAKVYPGRTDKPYEGGMAIELPQATNQLIRSSLMSGIKQQEILQWL
jgi:hypothetical protein